jgi:hypothetical protein
MAPVTPMPANAVKNDTKDTAVAGTSAPPPRPRPSERENPPGRARGREGLRGADAGDLEVGAERWGVGRNLEEEVPDEEHGCCR